MQVVIFVLCSQVILAVTFQVYRIQKKSVCTSKEHLYRFEKTLRSLAQSRLLPTSSLCQKRFFSSRKIYHLKGRVNNAAYTKR